MTTTVFLITCVPIVDLVCLTCLSQSMTKILRKRGCKGLKINKSCYFKVWVVIITIWWNFQGVTNAVATVNDCWPVVLLGTATPSKNWDLVKPHSPFWKFDQRLNHHPPSSRKGGADYAEFSVLGVGWGRVLPHQPKVCSYTLGKSPTLPIFSHQKSILHRPPPPTKQQFSSCNLIKTTFLAVVIAPAAFLF